LMNSGEWDPEIAAVIDPETRDAMHKVDPEMWRRRLGKRLLILAKAGIKVSPYQMQVFLRHYVYKIKGVTITRCPDEATWFKLCDSFDPRKLVMPKRPTAKEQMEKKNARIAELEAQLKDLTKGAAA